MSLNKTLTKLKTPEEYGIVFKNNVCLFQKSPLAQWYGGFKGQSSSFVPKGGPFGDTEIQQLNCCEQWMMAAKAVIMGDEEAMNKILKEKHPKKQQALGRSIKNYDQALWDKHKEDVIYYGNLWKFSQNEDLKEFLLSFPYETIFAEASETDLVYGIGFSADAPEALDVRQWKGKNLLGKVISQVRKDLEKK